MHVPVPRALSYVITLSSKESIFFSNTLGKTHEQSGMLSEHNKMPDS